LSTYKISICQGSVGVISPEDVANTSTCATWFWLFRLYYGGLWCL